MQLMKNVVKINEFYFECNENVLKCAKNVMKCDLGQETQNPSYEVLKFIPTVPVV